MAVAWAVQVGREEHSALAAFRVVHVYLYTQKRHLDHFGAASVRLAAPLDRPRVGVIYQ
jgi:hypothetical protein